MITKIESLFVELMDERKESLKIVKDMLAQKYLERDYYGFQRDGVIRELESEVKYKEQDLKRLEKNLFTIGILAKDSCPGKAEELKENFRRDD